MIKVAICDNEEAAANQIEIFILNICKEKGIPVDTDVFYNSAILKREIKSGTRYDLLYLGCRAENEKGIAAVRGIREMDENILIVYMSACDRYATKLFRFDIFAFIRKPVKPCLFNEIFLEANRKICDSHFYFIFHFKYEEYKLPCKEIIYFESIGKRIRINMQNGKEEIFVGKLSEVENRLSGGKIPFLRIHQSYLVNYYLIKSRTKTEVTLVNELKLPISDGRKKNFASAYHLLLDEMN